MILHLGPDLVVNSPYLLDMRVILPVFHFHSVLRRTSAEIICKPAETDTDNDPESGYAKIYAGCQQPAGHPVPPQDRQPPQQNRCDRRKGEKDNSGFGQREMHGQLQALGRVALREVPVAEAVVYVIAGLITRRVPPRDRTRLAPRVRTPRPPLQRLAGAFPSSRIRSSRLGSTAPA